MLPDIARTDHDDGNYGAGSQTIKVKVPMAELLKYAPELRSMTSDRGLFTMEYSHYEEVPPHMTKKILEDQEKA